MSFFKCQLPLSCMLAVTIVAQFTRADDEKKLEVLTVWPSTAPGESSANRGEALPRRENENPPATRIANITQPTLELFRASADKANGTAVIICPGGGLNYVVRDKEGSEIARWLNELGVTALVLKYRTKEKDGNPDSQWRRPLQDVQRSLRLVRGKAAEWNIDPRRIGVMGLSAGGLVAALAATRFETPEYEAIDAVDKTSCRPDFAMLLYPWQLWDAKTNSLSELLPVGEKTPPTFLVHTHDDGVTSLSSVFFYAALKQHRIPAELHIYQSGGHGYGLRASPGSVVHTWTDRARDWLEGNRLLERGSKTSATHVKGAIEPTLGCDEQSGLSPSSAPVKQLILPGDSFLVEKRPAFIMWPAKEKRKVPQPWIFYAPTLPPYPDEHEKWMHQKFLDAGVAVAGIDIGESYGSPQGQEWFTAFYNEATQKRGLGAKPCMLGRSRGGLWVSSWAAANPDKVSGIAGIYPVFDFRTYPGIAKAAPAYGLSEKELLAQQDKWNPIMQVGRLGKARVPALLIHGDEDTVVPLLANSAEFQARYEAEKAGSLVRLIVAKGQGHNYWEGFFRCQELIDFAIERAMGK